jgi:hypothetical protein
MSGSRVRSRIFWAMVAPLFRASRRGQDSGRCREDQPSLRSCDARPADRNMECSARSVQAAESASAAVLGQRQDPCRVHDDWLLVLDGPILLIEVDQLSLLVGPLIQTDTRSPSLTREPPACQFVSKFTKIWPRQQTAAGAPSVMCRCARRPLGVRLDPAVVVDVKRHPTMGTGDLPALVATCSLAERPRVVVQLPVEPEVADMRPVSIAEQVEVGGGQGDLVGRRILDATVRKAYREPVVGVPKQLQVLPGYLAAKSPHAPALQPSPGRLYDGCTTRVGFQHAALCYPAAAASGRSSSMT